MGLHEFRRCGLSATLVRVFLTTGLFLAGALPCMADVALVPNHALWKYVDDGVTRTDAWMSVDYNDASWASGFAPLGYGEPGVIVTSTTAGRVVNYFRRSFQLTTVPAAQNVLFRVWRDDIARVFINGNLIFDDDERNGEWTPPYQGVLPSSRLSVGSNVVAVEIRQTSPTSSDLVFDFELVDTNSVPPPPVRVDITSPVNNVVVRIGTNLQIQATTTGMSNVSTIRFFGDNILLGEDALSPYSVVWSNVPAGNHFLKAVAFSPTVNATSAPVSIMAVANVPPSVQIDVPSPDAIIRSTNITVHAAVSDGDGTVTNVAFFEGTTLIGQAGAAPFGILWQNVAEGVYSLTARATDNEGATATSAVVRIDVRPPVPPGVVRGPYLQIGTPTSIIVKWRTDVSSDSRVRFGTDKNILDRTIQNPAAVEDHEVKLTGLSPNTRYWYEIGSSAGPLASGSDYTFLTAPMSPKPVRIWAIGDSGTATSDAHAVAVAYRNYTGSRHTDAWLMLGDNAYGAGTEFDYQRAVFDFYPQILRQFVLWPTMGNHENATDYPNIFTLPTQGEAGGESSGTEHYYSFDYGNIHFVCLDAAYSPRGRNDVMCRWLEADLSAQTKEWLIAYWHQPPYSKGSHDSDVEIDLKEMRENAVPILEQHGVDLVLCGHSHCYERSRFLNGHYGLSSSLNPGTMFVDPGTGRTNVDGAYRKFTSGPQAGRGAVYVVAGSSGWATFGALNHPAMVFSELKMGSFVIDVDGSRLDARFLTLDGQIDDQFTMVKDYSDFRLASVRFANGDVSLTWVTHPGKTYQIQHAPGLPGAFVPMSGDIVAEGPITTFIHHTSPGTSLGFYRAEEKP